MSRLRALVLAVLLTATLLVAPGNRSPLAPKPARAAASGWTTYHLNNSRTANDNTEPAYSVHAAGGDWTQNSLDAEVFASPLVYGGRVFVASEANTVYALDETSGSVVWHNTVAPAVPGNATYIGCSASQFGSTDGITGTPVIDGAAGIIYVVAMTPTAAVGHNSEFVLYGLRTSDGSVVLTTPLAFGGLDPKYQNERAALGVANGYVYVIFGGRDGDCGTYHPWIVAAPTAGGAPLSYQPQSAGQNGAGMWAPSGMSIDDSGNVYVETGNGFEGNCSNPWDYGDGVLKLSPTLSLLLSSFRPTNWCTLNSGDADMGSVGPLLLANGEVFASGKSGDGWLLNAANLGGLGGQQFTAHVDSCNNSDSVFGGFAYDGARVFVPCDGHGLVALSVDTNAHTFATAWTSTVTAGYSASPGAPIVAGGVLWVEDQGGNNVYGFNPATGTQQFHFGIAAAHRFTTLAADNGRLFAMLGRGVQEFQFNSLTSTFSAYFPWFDRISDPGFAGDDIHIVNPDSAAVVTVTVKIPGLPGCTYAEGIPPGQAKHYTCGSGYGGPVVIQASGRVIASQRVEYNQSFNEEAVLNSVGATDLYLPWYDRVSDPAFIQDNIHVVNPTAGIASVTVQIPGSPGCTISQGVNPGAVGVFSCDTGIGGPVHIHSNQPVLASARVKYGLTFNEVPAQPSATATRLLSTWFDHASSTLFRADNIHVLSTSGGLSPAQVTSVSIPGCPTPAATQVSASELVYSCPFGQGFGGPVAVQATIPILVSQRVQYGGSFNEVLAQDPAAAGSTLWMSWYDHTSSPSFQTDNVHVLAAAGSSLSPSQVVVTIPNCSPSATQASASEIYYSCPFGSGIGGPVKVTSTVGGGVLVSQRVQFAASFNEVNAST
jgi:outer membrane protein assembly factor BamB